MHTVLRRQSTNSMVHASVWHICQCLHVSVYVVDLYQIVRSKSSVSLNHSIYGHVHACQQTFKLRLHVSLKTFTSIYGYVCMQALKAMSTDKYMHVSRTSAFVHINCVYE